jgi:transcription initiation factor TFIID subunit TAF12
LINCRPKYWQQQQQQQQRQQQQQQQKQQQQQNQNVDPARRYTEIVLGANFGTPYGSRSQLIFSSSTSSRDDKPREICIHPALAKTVLTFVGVF